MNNSDLLHQFVTAAAERDPQGRALTLMRTGMTYGELEASTHAFACGLRALGIARGQRVAIYLEKRLETVVAFFGASASGGSFVPVNPILKAEQVGHILRDCDARVLVTTLERWAAIKPSLGPCAGLQHLVLVGSSHRVPTESGVECHLWADLLQAPNAEMHRVVDVDMAAILYTSGSTGRPKGVVLSHRNIVAGATSVAGYLGNRSDDVLLAALPLSFDAGFSQLTTAFHVGARVVLLNYLLPQDVIRALEAENVTGLTAVPALWIQLAQQRWPGSTSERLRYIANTGGRLPRRTLTRLRQLLPDARCYLMYGLTEAFRATYLSPEEVDRRPDSIGKAIPNSEVLVLRQDGTACEPNEPGELVQRGALVAMGYWNDAEKTAERFKPLPAGAGARHQGLPLPEMAVYSGDIVTMDEEGFLYFVGRRDEMIKTSGYRVSPTEVEEILYGTGMIAECVAYGIPHEELGQSIRAIVTPAAARPVEVVTLLAECRKRMPAYMVPADIEMRPGPLPRNANGKIDRKSLTQEWHESAAPCPQ